MTGATAETPLVTALVPAYRSADFITATLDSLAAQTWPALEVLIGDDCSPDETLEVARAWAKGRDNVRILEREQNLGWLRNSNDLMARARGDYMFFAFHDDVVLPAYVEKLTRALRARPDAILAYSDVEQVGVDGTRRHKVYRRILNKPDLVSRAMVMARRTPNWWVPNRGVFRAEAFRRIGGIRPNEQGEFSADWTWLLHMSFLGEFLRVPETLCIKTYMEQSLSKRWKHDLPQRAALRRAGLQTVAAADLPDEARRRLTRFLNRQLLADRMLAALTRADIDTPRTSS